MHDNEHLRPLITADQPRVQSSQFIFPRQGAKQAKPDCTSVDGICNCMAPGVTAGLAPPKKCFVEQFHRRKSWNQQMP